MPYNPINFNVGNNDLNYSQPLIPNYQDQANAIPLVGNPAPRIPYQANNTIPQSELPYQPKGIIGWLSSPEVAQGFIAAGDAIMNSGYGGNIGAAAGGFIRGQQNAQEQQRENRKLQIQDIIARAQYNASMAKNNLKPVETAQGVFLLNEATGELTPAQNQGKQLTPYSKPQTVVNVSNSEEGAFDKAYGKDRGENAAKFVNEYQTQAAKSVNALNSLDNAKNQVLSLQQQGVTTGPLTPGSLEVAKTFNQIFPGSIDIKKIKTLEQLNQSSKDAAGAILSSGQYGTGNGISSNDLKAANQRVQSVSNTIEGNLAIIDTLQKLEQRKYEIGNLVGQLADKGVKSQTQINAAIKSYNETHPLFLLDNQSKAQGQAIFNGQPINYTIHRKK